MVGALGVLGEGALVTGSGEGAGSPAGTVTGTTGAGANRWTYVAAAPTDARTVVVKKAPS
jgi:hypothetical protein